MTKKAYQYIKLNKIPYNGYANVYGIIISIEKKRGFEKVVIKDEFGHVVIVPDLSLLDHVEVGYILRLHRSMISTPTKLMYKPHIRGNSAVVWDLSSSFIPVFHTSSTYTVEDYDEKRVMELRQLSSIPSPECQSASHFDLTDAYKKKILSHVLELPFESNENYSISQRSAIDNVSATCSKTISSFAELNSSFLSGKVYFNFVAFVAEIYRYNQIVYVRVFDGSLTPIAASLHKVNSVEVSVLKTMPEKDIVDKASDYLFDIACFGEHASAAVDLQVGNVAVFANARIYTRKMGDKVICLHEGEVHRRLAASVGNIECEIITAMKQRCENVLSDLYTCSQSQSVYRFTQTQQVVTNDSFLNATNSELNEEETTLADRKRKNDQPSSSAEPPLKKQTSFAARIEQSGKDHENNTTVPIENSSQNIPNELVPANNVCLDIPAETSNNVEMLTGETVPLFNTNDDIVALESQTLSHQEGAQQIDTSESTENVQPIVLETRNEAEVVDENSRDAAVMSVLNEIVDSLSLGESSNIAIEDRQREEVAEVLNEGTEPAGQSEEEEDDEISPELKSACKVIAQYKTLSDRIKKLFDFDDDTIATVDEEIEIIRTLEPDSPCVMENFICVDNFHFMNQSFYAHCVIFTGNCDTCLNEFRVDRKASIGCPFCLDKRQKSRRFKIGIRILLPIRKDFLIGLSREQIMCVFPSPALDSDKVTAAFHATEEDFMRWCSDVQVIATSVVGTYKIRPNYCRTITKTPTIIFVEDCDMEKKF
ncbi:unnamed protein product [Auanema sp. JU1783]|nr:unnamed protein product [Auanema sp. JU1783]